MKRLASGGRVSYVGQEAETDEANKVTDYIFAGSDRILTIDPTEGVLYNIEDHLSSASLIVKGGTIVQKLDYYPYGTERVNDRVGAFSARHTFTDKEKDQESGLQYFGARYYSPTIGRFTGVDPASIGLTALNVQLADPQSWNSYTYARNNPLILKDDTGRFWQIAAGAAIGAVVSGGLTYYQTGDINQSLHASAGGAVQGALIAFAGPATLLQTVGAGAGATAVGNSLSRTLDGSAVNAQTLALDAGAGAVGGAIGYGVGKAIEYGVGRVGGKVVTQQAATFKATNSGLADTIADGHAFDKHIMGIGNPSGKEFGSMIQTREQFSSYLRGVLDNPSDKFVSPGRGLYWDNRLGTMIIDNPKNPTAFRPETGKSYFNREVAKLKGTIKK
jgi:RHS repeat-associated protein